MAGITRDSGRGKDVNQVKKSLAARAGKSVVLPSKKNLKNAADLAVLTASIITPGVAGAARGAKAASSALKAAEKAKPYVKVTKGTQAKNLNATLKTPGAKKAGSPKAGTKVTVQKVVDPSKGASGRAARAGSEATAKTKSALRPTASFITGWQLRKETEKAKKK